MTTQERAIYIAPETTNATEPDATGAAYKWIPGTMLGDPKDEKTPIRIDYFNGRPFRAGSIEGVDGGELEIGVPVIGLSSAARAATSPPAIDWAGELFANAFGGRTALDGETVSSLAATALSLGSDAFDNQDLAALVEAGLPSGAPRLVPVPIVGDDTLGGYTLGWDPGVAFTASAVALGYERYRPVIDNASTFALVYVFNRAVQWTFLGCKVVGLELTIGSKGALEWKYRIRFDRVSATSKASLPAVSAGPAVTPLKATHTIVYLDGAPIASKQTTLSVGFEVVEVEDHGGVNGRAGYRIVGCESKVTIEPLWQSGLRDAKRRENGDTGARSVLVQIGFGDVAAALGSGALNALVFYMPRMLVMDESPSADGKLQRQSVTLEQDDPVTVGGDPAHPITMFRI